MKRATGGAIPFQNPSNRAPSVRAVSHSGQCGGEDGIVGETEVAAHGLIGEQPVNKRLDAVLAEAGELRVVDPRGGFSGIGDSDEVGEDVELREARRDLLVVRAVPSAQRQSSRATLFGPGSAG